MKSRLWIILLTGINAALLAVVFVQSHFAPEAARAVLPLRTVGLVGAGAVPTDAGFETTDARATRLNWKNLESDDWADYIANLRAAGCPEETVRDIFLPKINRLFAPRFAAITGNGAPRRYWQKTTAAVRVDMSALRDLRREKNDMILKLLGFNPDQELAKADPEDQKLDFLSEGKRARFHAIRDKYSDLIDKARAKTAGGIATPEDIKAIAALEAAEAAEISTLMTKDERLEYDLRNSPLAPQLQRQLDVFQPDEAEFRAIFQTRQALDGLSDSNAAAAAQGRQQIEDQLKATLGEQRYNEYIRDQTPDYQFLAKLMDRFGLDPGVAAQVYDYDRALQAQVQEIMRVAYPTTQDRQAALLALRQQADQSLGGILGNDAYALYGNLKSDWWKNVLK